MITCFEESPPILSLGYALVQEFILPETYLAFKCKEHFGVFEFQSSLLVVAHSLLSGFYPFSSKISHATLPSVSLTIPIGPGMLMVVQPLL